MDPQYPEGKLNDEDEGAIAIAIGIENGNLIINFGKPVAWLGLPPDAAMDLGRTLIKRAKEAQALTKS